MTERKQTGILPADRREGPGTSQQDMLNDEPIGRPERPTPINDRQRRQFQHQQEEEAPSFTEAFLMGRELDAVGPAIYDAMTREDPETDPEFELTQKRWDSLTKDIPVEDQDIFTGVGSEKEAENIRKRYLKEREMEEKIASAGWTGLSARLLGGLLDEGALATVAATEGTATPWILSAKVSRLSRAIRTGASAATTEAAMAGFVSEQRETKDSSDALWAGLMGAAIGAPFGAFARPVSNRSGIPGQVTGYANDPARFKRAADAQSEEDLKASIQSMSQMSRPEVEETLSSIRQNEQAMAKVREELDGARTRQQQAATEFPEQQALRELGEDPTPSTTARQSDAESQTPEWNTASATRAELAERVTQALVPRRKRGQKKGDMALARANARSRIQEAEQAQTQRVDAANREVSELESQANELEELVYQQRQQLTRSTRTRTGEELPGETVLTGTAREKAKDFTEQAQQTVRPDRSAGAAERDDVMPDRPEDSPVNLERVPDAASQRADIPFQNIRFDLYSRVAKSESNTMNYLGRKLLSDPVAGDSGKRVIGEGTQQVRAQSAAEYQDQLFQAASVQFLKNALPAWHEWAKSQGLNWMQRAWNGNHRQAFFERVSHAVRTGEAEDEFIQRAADAIREGNRNILEKAKDARLAGFEDVDESMRYIHRQWDPNKFRRLVEDEQVGGQGIEELLTRSILSASDDMPEEVARSMAKAIFRRFNAQGYGVQPEFNMTVFSRDVSEVRRVLNETQLAQDEVDKVVRHLEGVESSSKPDGGRVKFAKSRISMDEDTSITLATGRRLHFSDLVENNAEKLHMNYLRKMSGHIALARQFRDELDPEEVSQFGVRTDTVFQRLKQVAASEGATEKELNDLTVGFNIITGRPPEQNVGSTLHRVARLVRDWNFTRLMGQVGFAQVAEFGVILGQVGIVTALRNMPHFRSIVKRSRNGDIDEPMLRELEEFDLVFGSERMVFQPTTRIEDWGLEGDATSGALEKASHTVELLKRGVADLSGMSGITIYMQRLAGLSAGHRLLKLAKAGELDNARMKSLGIDSDMAQRIQRELNDKSSKARMESGRDADVMNLKDWEDGEAREVLIAAMHRWGSRMVQRNLTGELPAFMHTTLGSMLGQFRSFMMSAYQKQLLQGTNMKDFQTFMTFSLSMLFAGASYTAQQSLNSLGQDDPEGFRERRLSVANIGLSAFQRAGFASLIPGMVDTVAPLTPMLDEGIFQYGRSSGLATDFVTGNPTVDLIDSAYSGAKSAIAAPMRSDREFSQEDFRNLWGIMALNNTTGIRNVGNMLERDLPQRYDRDPQSIEDLLGIEDSR